MLRRLTRWSPVTNVANHLVDDIILRHIFEKSMEVKRTNSTILAGPAI